MIVQRKILWRSLAFQTIMPHYWMYVVFKGFVGENEYFLMAVKLLWWRVFVVMPIHKIALIKTRLAPRKLRLSCWSHSFILRWIPFIGSPSACRHWGMSCLISFREHEGRHMQNQMELQTNIWPHKSLWKYNTSTSSTLSANECKCGNMETPKNPDWRI